ncbi:MAG: HDOD domain-containing protein [Thermodesulfobacteriota bacterium]
MSGTRRESLREKVNELLKVSSIPSVVCKILDVTEDKRSNVHDLEKVIEHDQAISARVVGISNAVYYGFPRKISSISQAILVLGFDMVKGLAISTAVFGGMSASQRQFVTALWSHSFEAAMTSVLIAEMSGLVNKDSAFLAGLLHDIGKPIMCQIFGSEYTDIQTEGPGKLIRKEGYLFGGSHDEVGAWFTDKCKLPNDCVDSIRYHHFPERYAKDRNGSAYPPLVPIVYLADVIVHEGQQRLAEPCAHASISTAHAEAIMALNVGAEDIERIKGTVEGLKEQIADYY